MKKRGLLGVTLLALLLSGVLTARAGWFESSRSAFRETQARETQARNPAGRFDPMQTQAAWRYRNHQAANWRTLMLYR
jgi:hypothetical protein